MPINEGLFTSNDGTWETPQDFFDKLNEEFHFTIDVCATKETAKCDKFYTKEDDAFSKDWKGVCWMNPPYGNEIYDWMEKAYHSFLHGATVVCLVPARTDTKWWHDFCMWGEVRFVKGRLKFGNQKNSAPFPSAVIIFSNNSEIGRLKSYEKT